MRVNTARARVFESHVMIILPRVVAERRRPYTKSNTYYGESTRKEKATYAPSQGEDEKQTRMVTILDGVPPLSGTYKTRFFVDFCFSCTPDYKKNINVL